VDGLVSRVVNGVGPQAPPSLADVERLLDHGYLTDGVYSRGASRRWPNVFLLSAYVRAHLELAREYNQLGQFDAVAAQVHMALAVDPADPTALSIERALAAR
jgi:hypothetical protein